MLMLIRQVIQMAVIIQEVVGKQRGEHYYPAFSGVGRSLNYYPTGKEQPEDGVCELAAGLGKHIVDGGQALRFSPARPKHVLQTSTTQLALRDTQRTLCALDTTQAEQQFALDEGFNIPNLPVQEEARAGHLRYMISTYDAMNDYIVDSDSARGRHLVTFANVLKHGVFPLAPAVKFMLELGQEQMDRAVEIEFAGNIADSPNDDHRGEIYWLQIRPMVDRREMLDDDIHNVEQDKLLINSTKALGHGLTDGITAVVMVKPEKFSYENNWAIASEIAKINSNFTNSGSNYILMGPGRWGSSDAALGVPVKWTDIAAARLIVEQSLPGKRIDPSQGSHFFQNLTSFGVGYFTVGEEGDGSLVDTDFINACTLPLYLDADMTECSLNKLTDSSCLVCSDYIIIWLICLKHKPHSLYIILGMTPVTLSGEVTKLNILLLTASDHSSSVCNLTCYELETTSLRLVVKEDTRACEHVI